MQMKLLTKNGSPREAARAAAGLLLAAATFSAGGAARAQANSPEPSWLTAIRQGRGARTRDVDGHGMGALPSSEDELMRTPRFVIRGVGDGDEGGGAASGRPASVLLTDYLPPVQNQGKQGSCVAWSSGYYCYTYAVSKQRQLSADRIAANTKLQFSPAYLYHVGNHGRDRGMQVTAAFKILHEQGCASMAEMPYDPLDFQTPPDDAAVAHAARFKARNTGVLFKRGEGDPERLKIYLSEARQPFVTTIPILTDFPKGAVDPNYVYRPSSTPSRRNVTGLHAVTIVGYDDSLHAFRLVNSWGTRWGDQGFLWIDEEFVHGYAMDGCSIVAGGLVSRDPASGVLKVARHVTLAPPETAGQTGSHKDGAPAR